MENDKATIDNEIIEIRQRELQLKGIPVIEDIHSDDKVRILYNRILKAVNIEITSAANGTAAAAG